MDDKTSGWPDKRIGVGLIERSTPASHVLTDVGGTVEKPALAD
jgi:hypothetical protein